jgi:universal stress protein G
VLTRGFISDARKMEDYLVNTSKEKLDELSKNSRWRKTISRFTYAAATFAMK